MTLINFENVKRHRNHKKKKNRIVLENITTVHGTNHSSLKNKVASKLWMFLVLLNILATVGLLMVVRKRFNSEQIITRILSDTKVSDIPFPSVSICNYNSVSMKETYSITKLLNKNKISPKEIEGFFQDLSYLNTFDISKTIGNYSQIMKILKSHYYNIRTVMEELIQKCDKLLVYCEFNGKQKDCDKIFSMIQTYRGFCCAFNYVALVEVDDPLQPEDEEFEYYIDRSNDEKTRVITTSKSGRTSGLKVIINIEPKQYPPWMPPVYRARVLISDPNDFPEITVRYKDVAIGESLTCKVEPYIYTGDDSLRRIPPKKRGCWFHDEVFLEHTDRYSFETCNTECRMMNFKRHCGCLPYKYPADKNTRFCELADLPCLNDMIAHWTNRAQPCKPECFMECSDKTYNVKADIVPFSGFENFILQDHNVSELSSVHVYYIKSTCNTFKQLMLMDTIYFIGTYGGVFSLSFGGSLLTVFEITYLLLSGAINFIHNTYKKLRKKNKNLFNEVGVVINEESNNSLTLRK